MSTVFFLCFWPTDTVVLVLPQLLSVYVVSVVYVYSAFWPSVSIPKQVRHSGLVCSSNFWASVSMCPVGLFLQAQTLLWSPGPQFPFVYLRKLEVCTSYDLGCLAAEQRYIRWWLWHCNKVAMFLHVSMFSRVPTCSIIRRVSHHMFSYVYIWWNGWSYVDPYIDVSSLYTYII